VDNDIEQGMPRCDKCFEVLPCHDHPAPPKLSIISGGCSVPGCAVCESPSHKPDMVTVETPDGTIEYRKEDEPFIVSGLDSSGWPLRDSPFDTVHTDWPNLDAQFPDTDTDGTDVPNSEVDAPNSNVVELPVATFLDVPPDKLFAEATKRKASLVIVMGYDENGDEFFLWSSADSHTNNFLIDRAKLALMDAYEAEE
jgi:hypothetical protein